MRSTTRLYGIIIQNLPILLSINKILLEYLKLKSTCDCFVISQFSDCSFRVYLDLLYAIYAKSESTFQKLYILCQHFTHCFYHPIFPKNLLAKSTLPNFCPSKL